MRLRTLPLSLAGIVMGIFIAAADTEVRVSAAVLLVLTTISLQILSNLSNELGDTLHGTDSSEERLGMHYSLMDGGLTISEMKIMIGSAAVASALFGTVMIWCAFGSLVCMKSLVFILLGIAAIWAAMHYTLGSNPYGYRGLGDISVFLFFGLATVIGGYYLCATEFVSASAVLPAVTIGCFSVGVLNVNNLRDMDTDLATRVTVAIMLGRKRTRIYQTVLVATGWLAMITFTLVSGNGNFLYLIPMPLFALHLYGVWTRNGKELDAMLPLLVISSFVFSLLAGIGMVM